LIIEARGDKKTGEVYYNSSGKAVKIPISCSEDPPPSSSAKPSSDKSDSTKGAKPLSDSTKGVKHLSDSTKGVKPLSDSTKGAKPLSDSTKGVKPSSDSAKGAKASSDSTKGNITDPWQLTLSQSLAIVDRLAHYLQCIGKCVK
jgi:hypothetical protein